MLRELHREPLARRAVEPGDESVDDPSRHELDASKRGEHRWVEKISAPVVCGVHGTLKLAE
jgi:hypothetical protein